ncbi:c-type cytochrome [Piscinibacter sp.]|uniref:c-type cytochrome n=1 Tax=Piscinibacter sp. TaxID=1903157 RepID=UPI0039E6FD20
MKPLLLKPSSPALLVLALTLAAPAAHATPAEYGEAMFRLATERGCLACHALQAGPRRSDGLPPIAPAWIEIARRYRDDPAASERLTATVMGGSNAAARHWVGKVADVNMPPNAAVVSEREARALVNWILVLVP